MTDSIVKNIESIRPFLPAEPGLRAHVIRVAALTGGAVKFISGNQETVRIAEIAALLHHYEADPEADGVVKLWGDLGMEVPTRLRPLPAEMREIWDAFQRRHDNGDGPFQFVDSANVFDEQFENLPYEDLDTPEAFAELSRSGMLSAEFVRALQSFRIVTPSKLIELAKSLPVDPQTHRWFPAKSYEALYAHSMEVAEAASIFARDSRLVNESDAYLAGVFHDIGRVAFQQCAAKKHLQDWDKLGFPVTYAEFLVSGTDHAALGAQMLEMWAFPRQIVEAIQHHHRIELTSSALATVIFSAEDENESLPSCARDNIATQRLTVPQLRFGKAAG